MPALTCKACPVDILHGLVRNDKLLLPPHENGSPISVLHRQMRFFQFVSDMSESGETSPMDHVFLLRCPPVPRQEPIPTPDDLGVEVGSKLRPVVGQATYTQVTAQMRRRKVDILGDQISSNCHIRFIACVIILTTIVTLTS